MDLQLVIMLNIIFILCVTALAFFFGPDDIRGSRSVFAAMSGWTMFCFSGAAWVIYVIAHFVSKYW